MNKFLCFTLLICLCSFCFSEKSLANYVITPQSLIVIHNDESTSKPKMHYSTNQSAKTKEDQRNTRPDYSGQKLESIDPSVLSDAYFRGVNLGNTHGTQAKKYSCNNFNFNCK